jgi:hypothetical protein
MRLNRVVRLSETVHDLHTRILPLTVVNFLKNPHGSRIQFFSLCVLDLADLGLVGSILLGRPMVCGVVDEGQCDKCLRTSSEIPGRAARSWPEVEISV